MANNITLHAGPYKCGKTKELLRSLVEHKRQHPLAPATILVPSARYAHVAGERLHEVVVRCPDSSLPLLGVSITPFHQACLNVLAAAGFPVREMPEELRPLVVRQALDRLAFSGRLKHLEPLTGFQGTAGALLKLFDEFERAGFSPADLKEALARTQAETSRYAELAAVYEEYWKALDNLGCLDAKRVAFKARELLFAGRLEALEPGMLVVEGFDRVSPLQADVIAGLARHATRVVMAFDYFDGRASEAGGEEALRYLWNETSYATLIARLQPQIEQHGPAQEKKPAAKSFFRALDRFAEMKEIAYRCKRAIVERGRRPEELLVTARDVSVYRGAVEQAFEEAGLPYYFDRSVAVSELPFIRFVLTCLSLPLNDLKRATVLECLLSRFLNLKALGLTRHMVDELDALTISHGLAGGSDQWARVLEQAVRNLDSGQDLVAGLQRFFNLTSAPQGVLPLSRHCRRIEDLMESVVNLPSAANKHTHGRLTSEARLGERALRQAFRIMLLEEELLKPSAITYQEFVLRLDFLISRANFKPQPESSAVLITSADTAPNRTFQEIFIAGLVEGEFPRKAGSSGFAGSEELAAWSRLGVNLSDPRNEPGFEAALYRSLKDRALENLCLSYPELELSGAELVPSFFITEELGGETPQLPLSNPAASAGEQPVSARDALCGLFWHHPPGGCLPDLPAPLAGSPAVRQLWEQLSYPLSAALGRVGALRQTCHNGYLADFVEAGALSVYLPEMWSAKALNSYGRCPFQYWVSHCLRFDRRQEPDRMLCPRLRGQFNHKVLEIYYRTLAERSLDFRQAHPDVFEDAFGKAVSWLQGRDDFQPGPFWQNEQQDLRLRLARFIEWDRVNIPAGVHPAQFEVEFGRGQLPPLDLQTQSGTVRIRGIIDRIDTGAIAECAGDRGGEQDIGYAAHVVDYKTTTGYISDRDAFEGRNMQLPLYALAVENCVLPGSKVFTGRYLSINGARQAGKLTFKEGPHIDVLERTRELVGACVAGAARGDFTVRPNGSDVCKACTHRTVCRISELAHSVGREER